jgi:septum formation protein
MSCETIVLASNSPRRKQLLALGGWTYLVQPAEVDETPLPGEAAPAYVLRLAERKARAASNAGANGLVLAADTTVADERGILGKPRHTAEAQEMLRRLCGQTHQVFTGLAVLDTSNGHLITDLCVTDVPMRLYTEDEMQVYIASGDPLDKAGAYAIQHTGFHPVDKLEGCYANVMGLPLCHLVRTLRSLRVMPHTDVQQACQAELEYQCPVYAQILIN